MSECKISVGPSPCVGTASRNAVLSGRRCSQSRSCPRRCRWGTLERTFAPSGVDTRTIPRVGRVDAETAHVQGFVRSRFRKKSGGRNEHPRGNHGNLQD